MRKSFRLGKTLAAAGLATPASRMARQVQPHLRRTTDRKTFTNYEGKPLTDQQRWSGMFGQPHLGVWERDV